jgi:putative ABC transport system ATP-binding protein
MGASGSGKSTAMNIIGCLDTPSAGGYQFCGVEVGALDADQRARLRRHYIGFIFQGFNLLAKTSALDNVELPLIYRRVPKRERQERARVALESVGLGSRLSHAPSELSGGQQQRVAIARALVTEPALLLADEPTGNLDSNTKREIMLLLSRLNTERGITIAMVTHEPGMAEYAGRVMHFQDGRVLPEAAPSGAAP